MMVGDFQTRLADTAGLAVLIEVVVWLMFRLPFRRITRPPRISLHLFGLALGVWTAGRVFWAGQPWVGHAGAVLIFTTVLFLWALIGRFICGFWLGHHRKVHLPIILRQLGGVVILLAAGSSILKWGYQLQLTGLLATSGIAAVILGFAMQDLLSNVIAGFSIHMTGAYRVGDWLLLGANGERAEVMEINWRSTRLSNNDHVSFELPNSDIVKNRIVNLNYPTAEHGIRLQVGLDYDVPPAQAKAALLAAAVKAQGVLEHPEPAVFLVHFGDHSITYELRVWMRHAGLYNNTCDEIRSALWYELKRRNIRIPYPVRSLEVRQPNEPNQFVQARARAAEIVAGKALDCLTHEEAAGLVARGKIALFGTGEALVTRGEAGNSMFVVLDGTVDVVAKATPGPRVVLAKLGPGDCFGEMSLLTGEPRNATVRAEGDALVLEIRKHDLSPLIEANPGLAERLAQLLERRQKEWHAAVHNDHEEPAAGAAGTRQRSLAERIRWFFSHVSD